MNSVILLKLISTLKCEDNLQIISHIIFNVLSRLLLSSLHLYQSIQLFGQFKRAGNDYFTKMDHYITDYNRNHILNLEKNTWNLKSDIRQGQTKAISRYFVISVPEHVER